MLIVMTPMYPFGLMRISTLMLMAIHMERALRKLFVMARLFRLDM